MSARLAFELATEGMERVAGEVAVAFCFADDRPLRGPAGRADWRLCGDLSRFLAGSDVGESGEALLLPTTGRLRAGRLLLLGLGPSEAFGPDACARAVRDAAARLVALRVRVAVLGPPGDWVDRIPVGIGAQACVRGAVAALEGTGESLELRLVTPPEHAARVLRGLAAAAEDMRDRGVRVELPRPGPLQEGGAPARPASRSSRAGIHPSPPSSQP